MASAGDRPSNSLPSEAFAELVGQERAVRLLQAAVERDRVAPAYLFSGPDGVGKQLAAEAFAAVLLGNLSGHPDFTRVRPTYLDRGKLLSPEAAIAAGVARKAPPQIRIEQIRELTAFLGRAPLTGSRLVAIVEAVEAMLEPAANALLKTLEDPGRATIILLAPTGSLLPTLVSRCQQIPFRRLSADELATVLHRRDRAEILDDPALVAIAQGSPGAALQANQMRQSVPEELQQTLAVIATDPLDPLATLDLAKTLERTLDPPEQVWLTEYLQHVYWARLPVPRARAAIAQLEATRQALLAYAQPRLVWEVTLLALSSGVPPATLHLRQG